MKQKLLLVDFENVQQVDLARLDDSVEVAIFVGAAQKSIPIDLVASAQKLGARVEWHRIDANGKNALDFFIAYYLGRLAERRAELHCIVLSRDKGFDPLLRHLNKNGLRCRRINSMMELDPKTESPSNDLNYQRVIDILGKVEKKARPRKRRTLSQYIRSIIPQNVEPSEVERIIDTLFAKKMVSETNNVITYEF
jgi:hypothetical protein